MINDLTRNRSLQAEYGQESAFTTEHTPARRDEYAEATENDSTQPTLRAPRLCVTLISQGQVATRVPLVASEQSWTYTGAGFWRREPELR